ncbi:amino acid permease, partial [Neisseria sp.]
LKDPSMAYVMERIVGSWGATFISIGLIISLLGALLSWLLLAAESLYSASKDGTMPAVLHKENDKGVPVNALWASNLSMQVFLILALFSEGTYLSFVKLATSMILVPYLFSTAYAALIAWRGETYEADRRNRTKDLTVALIGVIYGVWLIYAAGLKYLLLSSLLYAPGVLVYLKARREQGERAFNGIEKVYLAVVLATAAFAAFALARGDLTL